MRITRILFIGVVAGLLGTTGLALDTYKVDPAHSSINFSIEHMVINTVHGRFNQFEGSIAVDPESGNVLKQAGATIQAKSIDTGISKRDDHLRGADFFDVAKNPTITFESKEVRKEGGEQVLVGNFTMHGVTKEIALPFKLKGPINVMGGTRLGFEAVAKLNRKDYGLTYNKALEAGGLMLGEDVAIQINAEFVKQSGEKKWLCPAVSQLPSMPERTNFAECYARGDTPWDSGHPSEELLRALNAGKLTGTTVLEIGCGTGTNAIELARRGFQATAADIVDRAIQAARKKALNAQVVVDFRVADILKDDLGGPYDILFDRGVYHCVRTQGLKRFQKFLKTVTHPGSWWLSLAGNAREETDSGPPVVSEQEIRAELGLLFDIVELREFRLTTNHNDFRPLAWSILMRRK